MKPNFQKRLYQINRFTSQDTIDSLFRDLYATYAGLLGFVLASFDIDDDMKHDIINDAFFQLYLSRNNVDDVKYYLCHQLISHPEKIEKRAEKPLKIILF